MKETNLLILDAADDVGVNLDTGAEVPVGHKCARRNIKAGEYVHKYGEIIGIAKCDIAKGEWVHSHNLRSSLDEERTYSYTPTPRPMPEPRPLTFMGYTREDSTVGIRNDIYIIPTVGCVNGVCKNLERMANEYKSGSVDHIVALTHQFGCSQLGDDGVNIKKLLCSVAMNPNAAYVLIVGLGCENNSLASIREYLDLQGRKNIAYLNAQDVEDELAEGFAILKGFIDRMRDEKREEHPISKLTLGLKCGGSDAFSGITANPTVGRVSDLVIASGGSSVLTEVPEMFGAEQLLMNRCITEEVYEAYKRMIVDFKKYYTDLGFPVYENPSPGNKAGGITTLEEKSLGCIKKGGNAPVVDVIDYAERVGCAGFTALCAPGNDLIAATALAAAGCQMVLFTTGRGTPFSTFVPTVKISTNLALAMKKDKWIDFDASSSDAEGLLEHILKTASGERTCHSECNYEIAFFKKGVTL